mgnify:CR=1 FL=1
MCRVGAARHDGSVDLNGQALALQTQLFDESAQGAILRCLIRLAVHVDIHAADSTKPGRESTTGCRQVSGACNKKGPVQTGPWGCRL